MSSALPNDLEIAPRYTVGQWRALTLDPKSPDSADWDEALKILDARIRRRFFDPVDALINFEKSQSKKRFGFAILALDFLIVETLQGFRDGILNHNKKSRELFTKFLMGWNSFQECTEKTSDPKGLAEQVYRDYRCALHHSGSTEGALRVGVSGPIFDFKSDHDLKINRTRFHESLKCEFEAYLIELRQPEKNDLRSNLKKKMNAICGM